MRRLAIFCVLAAALGLAAAASGASRPSAPAIAGPNGVTPGRHTYVFSSIEKGVPEGRIHFRCSLDTARLHGCARRVTFRLAAGNHLLRAQAVDPAGHRSSVSRLSISVQAVAPELTLTTLWQKPVTSVQFAHGALFGIALGPDGNVYIADPGEDQIQVYDPAGNLLRTWGSRGKGPGQFRFEDNPDLADADIPFAMVGIDQRTGQVYVGESQRIQKFDAQGNFQLSWGKVGIDNGQFTRVADLTIGSNGTVYVMEDRPERLGRVEEFDSSGNFLTNFGRGQFVDPGGIVLDGAGNILVADDKADNIKVFGASGKFLHTVGHAGTAPGELLFPADLALLVNTLYVADQDHFRVVRFDLSTGKPTGYWPTGTTQTVGLAADKSGDVYAIDEKGVLAKYAISG